VLIPALLLLALGLLMVTSASMPIVERQTGQPFHFLIRQGVFVLIGLFAGWRDLSGSSRTLARGQFVLLLAAIGMLILVLIPGIGKEVNGSMRWIGVGSINIQVSELAKLFTLVYVADYLRRTGCGIANCRFSDLGAGAVAAYGGAGGAGGAAAAGAGFRQCRGADGGGDGHGVSGRRQSRGSSAFCCSGRQRRWRCCCGHRPIGGRG
jgi:hypothetical protein